MKIQKMNRLKMKTLKEKVIQKNQTIGHQGFT